MKKKIKIAPSFLSADFAHIADEAKRIEDSGADMIHLDIMDGQFVKNISFGPQVVSAINRSTSLFLDVHLMIYSPFDYIERFIEAGADNITFHLEATEDVEETLEYIKRCNVQCGLSLRPETSVSLIPKFLTICDIIMIMAVTPGFGGQKFQMKTLEKIRFVREHIENMLANNQKDKDYKICQNIEVDGGIDLETARLCVEAGANVLVSGHYLFSQCKDLREGVHLLRSCLANKEG